MRIPAESFPNTLVFQLERLAVRQNRLQNQAATGQRIQYPEDDPSGMRRVLDLQAETKRIDQFQRNISHQQELAQLTGNNVRRLKTVSDRAGEIATLAGGVRSPEELTTLAEEVDQLLEQAVEVANTKHQGEYLFAGTLSDRPPFKVTTNENGDATSVAYDGNQSLRQTEIGEGTMLTAQIIGANGGDAGPRGLLVDARAGASFFNHLISLRDHLRSGEKAAITETDLPDLNRDEENFITHLGTNGALQARLEAAAALAGERSSSLEQLVSKEADADLAQTLVRLNETQNAYKAALQSGALILNNSLLDFLR